MLRVLFASVLVGLAVACASPGKRPTMDAAEAFQDEPVVAHLDLGGVT